MMTTKHWTDGLLLTPEMRGPITCGNDLASGFWRKLETDKKFYEGQQWLTAPSGRIYAGTEMG